MILNLIPWSYWLRSLRTWGWCLGALKTLLILLSVIIRSNQPGREVNCDTMIDSTSSHNSWVLSKHSEDFKRTQSVVVVRMLTLVNLETRTISSASCFPRFSNHAQVPKARGYRSTLVEPCKGWFGILPGLAAVLWTDRHTTLLFFRFYVGIPWIWLWCWYDIKKKSELKIKTKQKHKHKL